MTVKILAQFSLKLSWQTFFIVFCCIFQIFRKIFSEIKKLSYTNFYWNLITWFGWSFVHNFLTVYTFWNLFIQFNIKIYEVIWKYSIWNLIYAIMKFNMHRSFVETRYFLNSLISRKSLKLVDDISNQFTELDLS